MKLANIKQFAIRLDQSLAASSLLRKNTGESENIFFPGCSLMGYNPGYVFQVHDFLKNFYGHCGILTGCCSKPLKLLGETQTFTRNHERLKRDLDSMKAKRVITACQNCYRMLKDCERELEIISLWPLMLRAGLDESLENKFAGLEASIQDSCSGNQEIAESVREILRYLGVSVKEFPGKRFKCCGGIQAITTGSKDFMRERVKESPCNVIISYCASCRSAMSIGSTHKSIYLLDLIFGSGEPSPGKNNLINRFITANNLHRR